MGMNYIDTTAKTIDDAISLALKELGTDRDSVSVEILEKPKSGFLGFGAVSAKVRVFYEVSKIDKTRQFIEKLVGLMRLDATADVRDAGEGHIDVTLSGGDMGLIIGRRGENLDAMQYIANLAVNKGEEEHVRVNIDTENYRSKREESLVRLAHRVAEKVQKYKKNVTLETMAPNERRIIHSTLQDVPGITTFSTGVDPNRKVVVAVAGQTRPGQAPKKEGEASPEKSEEQRAPRPPREQRPRQNGQGGGQRRPEQNNHPREERQNEADGQQGAAHVAGGQPRQGGQAAGSAPAGNGSGRNNRRGGQNRRPKQSDEYSSPAPGDVIRTTGESGIYKKL